MKHFVFILLLLSTTCFAQKNIIRARATLIPNTGSFTATSENANGRLLKTDNSFSADRISVFVSSFQTENKLRDKHFSEHIGGGEYLKFPRIDITELKAEDGQGEAKLTLNGITKPIKIKYTEKKGYVDASFIVSSSEFNLPKAQYLAVGVENDVAVTVKYFYESKE